MKRNIGVESLDEMRKRKLARARLIDKGVAIEPETRIMFERAEDMLECLTPGRVHLLAAARKKEMSITELAHNLARPRTDPRPAIPAGWRCAESDRHFG